MFSEEVIEKLLRIFNNKVQLYEGTNITCGIGKTITVRLKNTNQIISAESINVTIPYQTVIVFYDNEERKYYTWLYGTVQKTVEDIIRYRKTRPVIETTYKLILIYLFSTDYYYNFQDKQLYQYPQTLRLNRIYDIFTTLLPGKINNRYQITGKCKGGLLKITTNVQEQYDVLLPFHKPTIEIFRTDYLTNEQFVFDNNTFINGDIASSLYSTYFTGSRLVRRVGGYRHYGSLDTNYPHNAIHYNSTVSLDDYTQSFVTGTIMRQTLSQEYLMYDLFPSFTDYFTICIYDYGIRGKPTNDYYGLEYPPIQLRQDSFTNIQFNIDLITQNIGMTGFSNNEPIYLNYNTFFSKLNHNVYVNALDNNEKYLINFKYENINKIIPDPNDSIVYSITNPTKDFNDVVDPNLDTFLYPHGSNDYIIVDKTTDNLTGNIKFISAFKFTFKYPSPIIMQDNLNNNLVDEFSIWNKEIVLNYLGGIGTGIYTFNSHTNSLNTLRDFYKFINGNTNNKNNFISWTNNTFILNPTKIITNYLNIISYPKQHINFPLFNLPFDISKIKSGLFKFKLIIEDLFGTYNQNTNTYAKNPNKQLNFSTANVYIKDKGIEAIVPQFGSYYDIVKQKYITTNDPKHFIFYNIDDFLNVQWNTFVNTLKSNQKILYPILDISGIDILDINSFYESKINTFSKLPVVIEEPLLGTNLNHLEYLQILINNVPTNNPVFDTFRLVSIFPLVVNTTHPLAQLIIT